MGNLETATLAGGCFWCTEAIFQRLKGVKSVESGYSGGNPPAGADKPSYEAVSTGNSGHAEAIQISFDSKIISYDKLLEVFFILHDPTSLNRQGADTGTQYRSVIFYHSEPQKKTAQKIKEKIGELKIYNDAIVTEIVPFENFYKAKDEHQNFYAKNPTSEYCQIVIDPKIRKLYKEFSALAKE